MLAPRYSPPPKPLIHSDSNYEARIIISSPLFLECHVVPGAYARVTELESHGKQDAHFGIRTVHSKADRIVKGNRAISEAKWSPGDRVLNP